MQTMEYQRSRLCFAVFLWWGCCLIPEATLPEQSSPVTACRQNYFSLQCDAGKLAIRDMNFGYKDYNDPQYQFCYNGNFNSSCCTQDPADCLLAVDDASQAILIYEQTGQSSPDNVEASDTTNDVCYGVYERSNYMLMEYYCIQNTRIITSLSTSDSRELNNGSALYVYNDELEAGSCSVEVDSCTSTLVMYTLVRDLYNDTDGCHEGINVTDGDVTRTLTCDDDTLYSIHNTNTTSNYIHLEFYHSSTGGGLGKSWVGFRAPDGTTLRINCPALPQIYCNPCPQLQSPENGNVSTANGITFGQTANYACNDGYLLDGENTTTCLANGTWSNDMPNCTAVDCGDPSPSNGAATGTYTYPTAANVSCNMGYNLVGGASITCLATGLWSYTPTCDPVDCDDPSPTNGTYTGNTTFPSTATISCHSCYSLSGSATVTCQSTGDWDSSPVCNLRRLCQLPESSNTSFACVGSVDESQLQPSCQLQSAVIAIQSIYAGVKRTSDNCTLGSGEPACCTRDETTDCWLPVPQSSSYYQDCSGRPTCLKGVQQYQYDGECAAMGGVEYDRFSNYLTMDYYCLPDARISQMCTTVAQATAADAAVYVWSPGYPVATVPGPNCTCSLETDDCEAGIKVFTVHVDLGANISDCQHTLEVIDGSGARLMSWTCHNNPNHYNITATIAAATYIQLVFTTMATTSAVNYFWIGFQSTSVTDGLRLRCPAEAQTTCLQTTTSTTTTPTTTSVTTTLPTTSTSATTTTQPTTSTTATTTTQPTTSTTAAAATTTTTQSTTTTIITTPPPTTTTAIPTTTTPPTTTMTTSSRKTNEDTRVEYDRDDTNIIIAMSVCSAALIVTISVVVLSYVYCCRKHRQVTDEEKKSSINDKQPDKEDIGTTTTGHYQKFSTDDKPPDKVWNAATDKVDIGTLTTCNYQKFIQLPSKSTQTQNCVNFITPIDKVTRNIDSDKKHELDITDNNVKEPMNTGYMAEREVVTKPPRTDNATDQNQRFKLLKILTDNKRVDTSKEEARQSQSDMVPVATVIPTNKRNISTNKGSRNDDVDNFKTLVKEGAKKDSSVTQTDGQKKIARETTLKQNKITGVVTLPPNKPRRTPDTNFKEKAITTNAKSDSDVSLTPSNCTSATLTSEYSDETSTRSQDNNRRRMAIQEKYKKMDGHGDDSDDVKDTEIIKAELSKFLSASKPVKEKQVLRKETEIEIESDVLGSLKYDQMFRTVAKAFYDIERSPKRRKKRKLKKRVT